MSPDYIIRSFKTTIQNPIDRHTTFILKENSLYGLDCSDYEGRFSEEEMLHNRYCVDSEDWMIYEISRSSDGVCFKMGDTLLDPEVPGKEFILTSITQDANWLSGIKLSDGTTGVSLFNAIKK